MLQVSAIAQQIPYPDALDNAAVIKPSIHNMDSNAMIIGNGDINALIISEEENIIMLLAKNDVWDARLVTEDDPPLLKVDVMRHSWMGGGRPASWQNPYPTQTPPAVANTLAPHYSFLQRTINLGPV